MCSIDLFISKFAYVYVYVLKDNDTNHMQTKNLPLDCVILFYNLPEVNIYVDISSSHPYISFSAMVFLMVMPTRRWHGRNLSYTQDLERGKLRFTNWLWVCEYKRIQNVPLLGNVCLWERLFYFSILFPSVMMKRLKVMRPSYLVNAVLVCLLPTSTLPFSQVSPLIKLQHCWTFKYKTL